MIKNIDEFANILSSLAFEYVFTNDTIENLYKLYISSVPEPQTTDYQQFKEKYSVLYQNVLEMYDDDTMFYKFYYLTKLVPEHIAQVVFAVYMLEDVDYDTIREFIANIPATIKHAMNIDPAYSTTLRNIILLFSHIISSTKNLSFFSVYDTFIPNILLEEFVKIVPVYTSSKKINDIKKIKKILTQIFVIIKYYGTILWIKYMFGVFGYDVELNELVVDFSIDTTHYYNPYLEQNLLTGVNNPYYIDMYLRPYNRIFDTNLKMYNIYSLEKILNLTLNKIRDDYQQLLPTTQNITNNMYLNGYQQGQTRVMGLKEYIYNQFGTLCFKTNRLALTVKRVMYNEVPMLNSIVDYLSKLIPYYLKLQTTYKFVVYEDKKDKIYTHNVPRILIEADVDVGLFAEQYTMLLIDYNLYIDIPKDAVSVPYLFSGLYIPVLGGFQLNNYIQYRSTPFVHVYVE